MMSNELLDICPLQFIEGINENEEPDTDMPFRPFKMYGVAIPYTPNVSYSLERIEIYGSLADVKTQTVKLYSDHDDNPSDICLAEGELTPSSIYDKWLPIKLEKNIVIFAKHKYWLCIEEHPVIFAVGLAKQGKELSLRANPSGQWESTWSSETYKVMLKFFGRVLPIIS